MKLIERSKSNTELYNNFDFELKKYLSILKDSALSDNDLNSLIYRIINNKKIYLFNSDKNILDKYQYDYSVSNNTTILKKILLLESKQDENFFINSIFNIYFSLVEIAAISLKNKKLIDDYDLVRFIQEYFIYNFKLGSILNTNKEIIYDFIITILYHSFINNIGIYEDIKTHVKSKITFSSESTILDKYNDQFYKLYIDLNTISTKNSKTHVLFFKYLIEYLIQFKILSEDNENQKSIYIEFLNYQTLVSFLIKGIYQNYISSNSILLDMNLQKKIETIIHSEIMEIAA